MSDHLDTKTHILAKRILKYLLSGRPIAPLARLEHQATVRVFEQRFLSGQEVNTQALIQYLYIWFEPEMLIQIQKTLLEYRKQYQENYRRAQGKTDRRGRPRRDIPKTELGLTVIHLLRTGKMAKLLNLNTDTCFALLKESGFSGLEEKALDPQNFHKTIYVTWRNLFAEKSLLRKMPESFYQDPLNWTVDLDKVTLSKDHDNLLYLWETLSPLGQARLAAFQKELNLRKWGF